MVDEKLVSVQKHPDAALYIYNYSPRVQFEKLWNEVTLQTRGLILDAEMNIIARPFKKFFNLEEHQPEDIPQMPFDAYEKIFDAPPTTLVFRLEQNLMSSWSTFLLNRALPKDMHDTSSSPCLSPIKTPEPRPVP